MLEDGELKQIELNAEEREVFLKQENNVYEQNTKQSSLNYKVLFYVLIGIGLVFGLMMIINGLIFGYAFEQKTAFYLSILASNTLFLLLIFIIKLSTRVSWQELGYSDKKFFRGAKDVFKVWGLTWLLHIIYIIVLFEMGINPPENPLLQLIEKPSLFFFIANVFLIAVAAPFIEETLFRGLLFGSLKPYMGIWTAIVVSAIIFSALHFELAGFVPRFALGIGLGYLYVKHNSIYPAVLLHSLNNLVVVVLISVYS